METIKAFKQDQINAEHNQHHHHQQQQQQKPVHRETKTIIPKEKEQEQEKNSFNDKSLLLSTSLTEEGPVSNKRVKPELLKSQRQEEGRGTNCCYSIDGSQKNANIVFNIINFDYKRRQDHNDQENSITSFRSANFTSSTQNYSSKSWDNCLRIRKCYENKNEQEEDQLTLKTTSLVKLKREKNTCFTRKRRHKAQGDRDLSIIARNTLAIIEDNNNNNDDRVKDKSLQSSNNKEHPSSNRKNQSFTKSKLKLNQQQSILKLKSFLNQQSILILLLVVILATTSIELSSIELEDGDKNVIIGGAPLEESSRAGFVEPFGIEQKRNQYEDNYMKTNNNSIFHYTPKKNHNNNATTTTNQQHHQKHRRHRRGHNNHVRSRRHHHHLKQQHDEKQSSATINSISERSRRSNSNDVLGLLDQEGAAERPVVATRKGLVRGITQKLFTGKNVDAFLGIPYAQPPTGKFRFRHPQPIKEWPGVMDASRMPNSCYQINDTFFGSNFLGTSIWNANTQLNEDCLYLNIWTPFGTANYTIVPPTTNSQQQQQQQQYSRNYRYQDHARVKRPVLVWIFGGGFYSGTTSLALYDGGVLASEEDLILVSMNYRVSSLGFLYFGRPDAPGNSGLFDQLMALQWIRDNIEQFGGDPNRITIFGESAGAVSISLHMLSPLSRDLFNQAILQSGAATCPWGYMEVDEIMSNGLQLAQLLSCPYNKSDLDQVMECLLKADPMALVSQEIGQSKTVLNFPFVPVVDGSFLLESPAESMSKSNFKPAKVLLGSNFDEGNSWLVYMPEFSHCPSADKPQAAQTELVLQNQHQSTTSNGGSDGNQDDSFHLNSSLDFIASPSSPSGSSYSEQRSASSSEQFNSISKRGSGGEKFESFDSFASGRQQQQQQLSNAINETNTQSTNNNQEAKPCKPNEHLTLTREDFLRILKDDFLNPYAKYPISKEAIVFEYSNWNNPNDSVSNYDALDKIVGDYYFTCHVNDFAIRYANAGNSVYMYYFKQHSSISPWPKWMGVLHGDEINFVFGEPLNQMFNYTQKEVELSRRMMRYWANFAKYGNPTKFGENVTVPERERWPEYSDKRQYFELHGDFIRIGRGPRAKQCAFWSSYLPQLLDSFNRQCPAHPSPHQRPFLKPQNTIHPSPFVGAGSSSATLFSYPSSGNKYTRQQSSNLIQNIPSLLLVSLLVILLLAIVIGLLVYAQRTGKLNLISLSSSGTTTTTTTNNNNNNSAGNAGASLDSGADGNSRNNNTNC